MLLLLFGCVGARNACDMLDCKLDADCTPLVCTKSTICEYRPPRDERCGRMNGCCLLKPSRFAAGYLVAQLEENSVRWFNASGRYAQTPLTGRKVRGGTFLRNSKHVATYADESSASGSLLYDFGASFKHSAPIERFRPIAVLYAPTKSQRSRLIVASNSNDDGSGSSGGGGARIMRFTHTEKGELIPGRDLVPSNSNQLAHITAIALSPEQNHLFVLARNAAASSWTIRVYDSLVPLVV